MTGNVASFSQEVIVVQLSEKEKQALQEKYKAQRQAMWSGKQSASQDSEEGTVEESDNQTTPVNAAGPIETSDEETSQDQPVVQTESDSDGQTSIADLRSNTGDTEAASQSVGEAETSTSPAEETSTEENTEDEDEQTGERVFWEPGMAGGPSIVTWKLVLAVIGIGMILVGVGVWLGFWFAG